MSCQITDINFNHYLLPEIFSEGLKINKNHIYNEDNGLVGIEISFHENITEFDGYVCGSSTDDLIECPPHDGELVYSFTDGCNRHFLLTRV
jgi:hypothetical protein